MIRQIFCGYSQSIEGQLFSLIHQMDRRIKEYSDQLPFLHMSVVDGISSSTNERDIIELDTIAS